MLIAILTGVRSGRRASLMSGTGSLRPRFKQQVAMDDKADPRARSYRDRGLDVEIARRDLVAGSRTAGLRGKPDRAHEIAVAGQRKHGAYSEQRREDRKRTRLKSSH